MFKIIFSFIFLAGIMLMGHKGPKEFDPIESEFPIIWKSHIGIASFRSNITFNGSDIIIGSNGSNFMDYNLADDKSGVYVLNGTNGNVKYKISNKVLGDMDVNGVLYHNGKLYFGNDNEEFLCTTYDGKIIWRNPTSGDIESEPVLIQNKGVKQMIYASELGEVTSINPETGKTIWQYFTPEFSGWRPGENRSVFKVKAFFSNTVSFFTKPQISDIDLDGIKDLIYLTRDNQIIAINGSNGKLLWKKEFLHHYLDNFISITGKPNDPLFVLNDRTYDSNSKQVLRIIFLNRKGDLIKSDTVNNRGYSIGLNSFNMSDGSLLLSTSDYFFKINPTHDIQSFDRSLDYPTVDYKGDSVISNRAGRETIFANRMFTYNGNDSCILLLNQHDDAYWNKGFIEIVSLKNMEVIKRLQLPFSSEMAPLIGDSNHDGFLDVVISTYDGRLNCYNLNCKY